MADPFDYDSFDLDSESCLTTVNEFLTALRWCVVATHKALSHLRATFQTHKPQTLAGTNPARGPYGASKLWWIEVGQDGEFKMLVALEINFVGWA
jgi:hypothetical protein